MKKIILVLFVFILIIWAAGCKKAIDPSAPDLRASISAKQTAEAEIYAQATQSAALFTPTPQPYWKTVGEIQSRQPGKRGLFFHGGVPYVGLTVEGEVMKFTGNWQSVGGALSASPSEGLSFYLYNGIPYAAYSDAAASNKITVKKYNGSTWETLGTAGFSTSAAYYQSLFVHEGIPYIAYQDGAAGKANVKKYTGEGATGWVTMGMENFSPGTCADMSLFVYGGKPYVAFRDGANSNKLAIMKYNGSSFMPVETYGRSVGLVRYVSLQVLEGVPYVAYADAGISEKLVVKKYNGYQWEAVGMEGFSPGVATYISLVIENGLLYAAYFDNATGMNVVKYTGEGPSGWQNVGDSDFFHLTSSNVSLAFFNNTPYLCFRHNADDKTILMKYE